MKNIRRAWYSIFKKNNANRPGDYSCASILLSSQRDCVRIGSIDRFCVCSAFCQFAQRPFDDPYKWIGVLPPPYIARWARAWHTIKFTVHCWFLSVFASQRCVSLTLSHRVYTEHTQHNKWNENNAIRQGRKQNIIRKNRHKPQCGGLAVCVLLQNGMVSTIAWYMQMIICL